MPQVKTHTFALGKYRIIWTTGGLDGCCDRPDAGAHDLSMIVIDGNSLRALHSQLHEAMEANKTCDRCLHDAEGNYRTWPIASFLWRKGWRCQ